MNWSGGIRPAVRMPPAHQRLEAAPCAGGGVDERLVVQLELAARDGVAQIGFQRVARLELGRHRFIEDGEAVAARRFRAVERKVGLLQQLLLVAAVIRRDRDADAGADLDAMAGQQERLGDELGDPRRQLGRAGALVLAVLLDDGEFVAAEPRQHVGCAQRRFQSLRHQPQQRVAGAMTEGIVDVLEAIEIEHQDREGRTAIPELAVELVEPGEEKGAVRQSGQDVGLRKLEHAAVGQRQSPRVAAGEHQIGRKRQCQQHADDQHGARAIVSRIQRAAGGRNRPHLPIGVTDPEMAGPVTPPRDVTHRLRRGGCGGVIGQHAFQADDARVEGLIDVHADRGARPSPDADGLHQQREVEDADNEARDVAAPVDDGIARGALGVNGHDHEHVRQLARVSWA